MIEWQVIIADLLQQIIIMFRLKPQCKTTKKGKWKRNKTKCYSSMDKVYLLNQKVGLNVNENLP